MYCNGDLVSVRMLLFYCWNFIKFVFFFFAVSAAQRSRGKQGQEGEELPGDNSLAGTGSGSTSGGPRGPHFDLAASKNVTALLGKTAYLNCRVKNLGNKTVRVTKLIILYFSQEKLGNKMFLP